MVIQVYAQIMLFKASQELHPNIVCFTTSTLNGVSSAQYSSLNLGYHVGDALDLVIENRKILDNILFEETNKLVKVDRNKINPIKWLKQAHTCRHAFYNGVLEDKSCDSISTSYSLTPLAVLTADCMPIVLSSSCGQISAIHAGWRGLISNIIENVVSEYKHTELMRAYIGPSICKKHFEITEELLPTFKHYSIYITHQEANKYQVDLAGIATKKLSELGVKTITNSRICSYQHPNCFSHRKSTHLGNSSTGRMATVVMRIK